MNSFFEWLPTNEIKIAPEALMINEIAVVWERDKTKDKRKARKEITFIWGMCCNTDKNIWIDFKDELERARVIKQDLYGTDSDWKPDAAILNAIDKYKLRIPRSALDIMLDSVETSILKLSKYLDSVDFNSIDNAGRLIHDPKKVRDIISSMGKTVTDYNNLKREIAAGKIDTDESIRGGGVKGYFEQANAFN